MLTGRCFMIFIGSKTRQLLGPTQCLNQATLGKRHVTKGVQRIFRTKLPQYKVNIGNLPPLSKLLTHEEKQGIKIGSFEDLVTEKLLVYKQYMPYDAKSVLLEALFNPENDVDKLLRIIDINLDTMTSFYVGLSFEVLDDMVRHGKCDKSTILVSPELTKLCKKALAKMRFFEADEVLKTIKCLSSLSIPEDSLLVQSTLQMARHLINDFNLDELEVLSVCLDTFVVIDNSKKSLLLALKEAVPIAQRKLEEEKMFTRRIESKRSSAIEPQSYEPLPDS